MKCHLCETCHTIITELLFNNSCLLENKLEKNSAFFSYQSFFLTSQLDVQVRDSRDCAEFDNLT